MRRCIQPGQVAGTIGVPGSRSMTNRALVIAALAPGASRIRQASLCDDTDVMIEALRTLGARIEHVGQDLVVHSNDEFGQTNADLWAGASGTTARFLTALAAVCPADVRIDGEPRLRERPLRELIDSLRRLGATVDADTLPVRITGSPIRGGSVRVDASASTQFVSALAMIAPTLDGGLTIEWERLASRAFVEMTVDVMQWFGVEATLRESELQIPKVQSYRATNVCVPPDAASAVYPALAAALTGGHVLIEELHREPFQPDLRVFEVLERMGARVEWQTRGVAIRAPNRLSPVDADMRSAPDGALVVAVAAAFAPGTSTIRGLGTLSSKESDRLEGLVQGIRALGAVAKASRDTLQITGPARHGSIIDPHSDHRMAMVFSVAGLALPGLCITDSTCVSKTWPDFYRDMELIAGPEWAPETRSPRVPVAMDVVAIDGPGGSGKTTVSRALATRLGVAHLDTGAFYRAVTLESLRQETDESDLEPLASEIDLRYENGRMFIGGEDVSDAIRSEAVDAAVSRVSADAGVRREMVRHQRRWVTEHGGRAVVEGRDIGTVVFPNAHLKVFLTARPEVRASRRASDLRSGVRNVREDLERRDELDASRAVSPLAPAEDAIVLDTSDLSVDQVVDKIVELL